MNGRMQIPFSTIPLFSCIKVKLKLSCQQKGKVCVVLLYVLSMYIHMYVHTLHTVHTCTRFIYVLVYTLYMYVHVHALHTHVHIHMYVHALHTYCTYAHVHALHTYICTCTRSTHILYVCKVLSGLTMFVGTSAKFTMHIILYCLQIF